MEAVGLCGCVESDGLASVIQCLGMVTGNIPEQGVVETVDLDNEQDGFEGRDGHLCMQSIRW
jgi:hypothetical protein